MTNTASLPPLAPIRDTMTDYLADRAPAFAPLAPFNFFRS